MLFYDMQTIDGRKFSLILFYSMLRPFFGYFYPPILLPSERGLDHVGEKILLVYYRVSSGPGKPENDLENLEFGKKY